MDFSISNAVAVSPTSTVYDSPSSTAQSHVAASAAAEVPDTVRLSQTAQIHALIQQGLGAAIIASTLGIPVSSVDSILGIVVAAPVVVVAPASIGR
jgi:protein-disulfide isomerase